MKTARSVPILIAAVMVLAACASPPARFTAADEAELRALFDSTVSRVRAKNWEAWAGEFTDSALFHPSNAKALRGRPAILAWGQGFPPFDDFSMWDVHVWGEGNLAYGSSAVGIRIQGAPADTSKQLVVFQRSLAGKWEVAAVSVNSDLPPAPALAPAKK